MSTSTKPVKSNSLTELGYKIVSTSGKDPKGNEFVLKATGAAPVFFIKRTKKGRLVAVRDKESMVESTIEGLYNFKEVDGDLVGTRATPQAVTSKSKPATAVA